LRIFGEGQDINMHTNIVNLNEETAFSFIEYTNDSSTFDSLDEDNQNFILIEELDTTEKTIKGTFGFKIENASGEFVTITNGSFNCSYHGF